MRDGLPERLVGVEGEEYIIGVFVRSCPGESLRFCVSVDRTVQNAELMVGERTRI
jgi:hypothetical protein